VLTRFFFFFFFFFFFSFFLFFFFQGGGIFPPEQCSSSNEAGNHVVQLLGYGHSNGVVRTQPIHTQSQHSRGITVTTATLHCTAPSPA
jgi:hypothetical protein